LGACLGNYFPGRIVEVHFAAGKPAEQAQYFPLGILTVVGTAITILVALISSLGIRCDDQWHGNRDMQKPYPI
jgi:hypothetical protein